MTDAEIKNRFTIMTWAIGGVGVLEVATLGMIFTLWQAVSGISYQLGQISGELTVLINHAALK